MFLFLEDCLYVSPGGAAGVTVAEIGRVSASARVGGSSDEARGEAVPVRGKPPGAGGGVQGRAQAHRVILTPALRSALPH